MTLPDLADTNATSRAIAFDLSGQLRHVDLRRMPREASLPAADTDVNADYHAVGSIAHRRERGPARDSRREVRAVDRRRRDHRGRQHGRRNDRRHGNRLLGRCGRRRSSIWSASAATSTCRRLAPSATRARSTRTSSLNGSGTTPKRMNVAARGSLTDTTIIGGTIPQLDFRRGAGQRHGPRDGQRRVRRLRSGSGERQAADEGDRRRQPERRRDSGACLERRHARHRRRRRQGSRSIRRPSAASRITRASVDARLSRSDRRDPRCSRSSAATSTCRRSGTLALNDTGQSNLKVHADSPSLEEIGKLINQPLSGIAKVDATVTGNKQELQRGREPHRRRHQISGQRRVDGVERFHRGGPEPRRRRARPSSAETHGDVRQVAGQNINELDATTIYPTEQSRRSTSTAHQPQRSLGVGGSVLLHPDHQEVHLTRLGARRRRAVVAAASGRKPRSTTRTTR